MAAEYLPTSTDEDWEETEARKNNVVQSRDVIAAETVMLSSSAQKTW